jgi:hypothetical protein
MKKQDWMNDNRKTVSKIELSRTLWINSQGVPTGLDAIGELGGDNNNTGVRTDFLWRNNNNTVRFLTGNNDEAAMRNNVSDLHCQQLEQYNTITDRLALVTRTVLKCSILHGFDAKIAKSRLRLVRRRLYNSRPFLLGHHCRNRQRYK